MLDWKRIVGGPRTWAFDIAVSTAVGVFLGLIGPFGSYDRPLALRLVYCVAMGWSGMALYYPLIRLQMALMALARAPVWLALPAATAGACLPLSLVVGLVQPILMRGLDLPPSAPPSWPAHYLAVLSLSLPLTIVWFLVGRRLEPRPAPAAPDGPPRLLGRLPPRLGTEVLALQAEDHYVRVHTAKGSALILMRFADAVAETDGLDGLRVHRSWWVARSAISGVRREGRAAVIELGGGLTAPVSRNAMPQARAAGLLNAG